MFVYMVIINANGSSLEQQMIRDFESESLVLSNIAKNVRGRYTKAEQERAFSRLSVISQSMSRLQAIQLGGHASNLFGHGDKLSEMLYEQFLTTH